MNEHIVEIESIIIINDEFQGLSLLQSGCIV